MKTFIKLIIAVFALGFATANAAPAHTSAQTAAIKAVTDAVATGDAAKVKAAVSEQVAAFPEIAGDIVKAALDATGTSSALEMEIVKAAAFTAPFELSSILIAIKTSGWVNSKERGGLNKAATQASKDGKLLLKDTRRVNPPGGASPT
jgi:hypothetical protein